MQITPTPSGGTFGVSDGAGRWSPDGNRVVYTSDRDFFTTPSHLWLASPDGAVQTNVTGTGMAGNVVVPGTMTAATHASWSPDGQDLLFDTCCQPESGVFRGPAVVGATFTRLVSGSAFEPRAQCIGSSCHTLSPCPVGSQAYGFFCTPIAPAAATGVRALAGDTEATLTWDRPAPNGAGPPTSYTVTASPGGVAATVPATVSAATVTGLNNGTSYTFTVTANNAVASGPASTASSAVTPHTVQKGAAVAVLPALANGAYGGYLTTAYLENFQATPANIRVQYFDQAGQPVGKGNSAAGLPFWGTWTLRQDNLDGLGSGQPGSAIVYSDQPLAIFVNEFAPGGRSDASSYTAIKVPTGTASKLFAPAIASAAYDGYTTGIGLLNTGTATTDVKITYRGQDGSLVKSQTLPGVAPGAYQGVYSGDSSSATDAKLPSGFAGTAVIESTSTPAQPLAAVVNEVGPGGQFSSTDAVAAGQLQLQAPVALNNAYGGFNTGMGIQETSGHSGTVTVTYYDDGGAAIPRTFAIAANGYLPVYQGDPVKGPPAGHYTATISSGVPVAAIVNEVAAAAGDARQSTGYNTFAGGTVAANLPLVESDGADGWSTGLGIMNSGASTTMVTVTYFDASTGAPVGASQSKMLQPHAFWGLYQPDGGLPAGTRASAEVRASSGGTVAVICNESSPSSFMSYGGQ